MGAPSPAGRGIGQPGLGAAVFIGGARKWRRSHRDQMGSGHGRVADPIPGESGGALLPRGLGVRGRTWLRISGQTVSLWVTPC